MALQPELSVENWSSLWCAVEWTHHGPVPEKSRQCPFHARGFRAWYLEAGQAELEFFVGDDTADPVTCQFHAGQWLLVPKGRGQQIISDDAELLSLSFFARWPTGENLVEARKPLVLEAEHQPALLTRGVALARACKQHQVTGHQYFAKENLNFTALCRINTLFYSWLEVFLEAVTATGWEMAMPLARDDRLAVALRLIGELPLNQPFRVDRLAHHAGISLSQLNRLFHSHYGRTPKAIFEERRREFARRQVENGKLELKEIAYDLGFSAPPHFTAWFKRAFGQTPSALRKGS